MKKAAIVLFILLLMTGCANANLQTEENNMSAEKTYQTMSIDWEREKKIDELIEKERYEFMFNNLLDAPDAKPKTPLELSTRIYFCFRAGRGGLRNQLLLTLIKRKAI